VPERTASDHRGYDLAQLLNINRELSYTVCYARVSSHDQKTDLEIQKQVLELFCAQHGWQYQIIEEY
jgi:predicted site-specific integrase-resolvase